MQDEAGRAPGIVSIGEANLEIASRGKGRPAAT
jgi:hypothetical protein